MCGASAPSPHSHPTLSGPAIANWPSCPSVPTSCLFPFVSLPVPSLPRLAVDMDIHGYIHGYIHVWISDLGHPEDICMDIMLAHLLIKLTTYLLYLPICLSVCCS